jgi:DNA (cytosine-5)-methyltransferase 1
MTRQAADRPTILSLFCGAGGLDLGFEAAGFRHLQVVDFDHWCIETLRRNRPEWNPLLEDVCKYDPTFDEQVDVLAAGFPCQGFSLGGNRDASDERNELYKQVGRLTRALNPRAVVIENVLNLRTMRVPGTNKPFAEQIADELRTAGYTVLYDVFKVCHYDVPQTRRRFVFVAFRGAPPDRYHFPSPSPATTIRHFLYDLGQGRHNDLPNHDPHWGFKSHVHVETGAPFDPAEEVVPVRFSRTASDGNPIRSFDKPFPAVDTATVWGWAQGNVEARRVKKDRTTEKFIRNPDADVTLWRVSASRLRTFTHREYARLQTFPDDWIFEGSNKRDVHLQVGNAVPVQFAVRIAKNVRAALDALTRSNQFSDKDSKAAQLHLLL